MHPQRPAGEQPLEVREVGSGGCEIFHKVPGAHAAAIRLPIDRTGACHGLRRLSARDGRVSWRPRGIFPAVRTREVNGWKIVAGGLAQCGEWYGLRAS